jgi:hypothetical protein|nr:hypothetical protein [Kofleriaceae bacterium]
MSISIFGLLAVLAIARTASGHVVPSVDDNNRYLKLAPLGDRVRIAYTVFFGDNPGRLERQSIDADRDGQISEAEAHAFGDKLAAQVAAGLEVEVDGVTAPVTWSEVDVGMGTPAVDAGAFSIDLVTYACFAQARGRHHVRVHDRFRVPHAGETEVKVEDSPGVTVERARVGAADAPDYDYKFVGPGGPLSDDGLDLTFVAGDQAAVVADGVCDGGGAKVSDPQRAGDGSQRRGVILGAIGGVAMLVVAGGLLRARAKSRVRR